MNCLELHQVANSVTRAVAGFVLCALATSCAILHDDLRVECRLKCTDCTVEVLCLVDENSAERKTTIPK